MWTVPCRKTRWPRDADCHEQTAGHPAPVAFWWHVLCHARQAGPQGALCEERGTGHELAINRNAIANSLLGGEVQPLGIMGYHPELRRPIWPGIWNPEWDKRFEELYGYDPHKAKALLEQAGYPNGFEFTVYLYTCQGCRSKWISGRPWRWIFRRW